MAKKIYVVKRGRNTGLFNTWEECKAQVEGYQGAVYKGFMDIAEANAWMWGSSSTAPAKKSAAGTSAAAQTSLFCTEKTETFTEDYVVYTDGSCLRNPDGPGGWAAVIRESASGKKKEISGGEPSTTNNRMELMAGIMALKALPEGASVAFYADSQYLQNAFVKRWLSAWKRRGWITSTGTPVKNQDLWAALDAEVQRHKVFFHWVKGHAGNEDNERCDVLAKKEAMKYMD
ncbi:MAG: ribonuclease HI [Schwartzia sp.]|nr:ribonuclease HI [Schwartzia sp. (in: firmicutes)]